MYSCGELVKKGLVKKTSLGRLWNLKFLKLKFRYNFHRYAKYKHTDRSRTPGNTPSKEGYMKSKNEFFFDANTSSKEKSQEKQKYFRIPVCVLHKCSKLFTAWMQQKEMAIDKPAAFTFFPF